MLTELTGRTAVVTGAGSGMGRAFAVRLATEGMSVVAADVQDDALAATVETIRAEGGRVEGVRTDVADPAQIVALARAATDTFGGVQLLCNNAGVEGYLDGPIWEATDRDWAWTTDVNFWSVVHGIRTFVPIMLTQGEPAHIVNTCSMTSVIAAGNMYGVTKHAVLALSEVLARHLREADAPIGVTALCPGTIATNLFRGSRNRPAALQNEGGALHSEAGAGLRDEMHELLAAGMSPETVAALVVRAVRRGDDYLLTDHEWDEQIVARHEAILGGAVDPGAVLAGDAVLKGEER